MSCDAKCWTDVDCARCGLRKAPRGRSVPMEAANSYCSFDCPGYDQEPKPPHLWGEHDSCRHYSDPEGWAAHEADCNQCMPSRESMANDGRDL